MANRIDETGERAVYSYLTVAGEMVDLSLTGFEHGALFTRANILRKRWQRSGMAEDREALTAHEREMLDTYKT